MPTARHIQPMGFLGRLEAIRAPTKGKVRKGNTKMSTALSPPVPQLLGGCKDRVARYNPMAAAHKTSESTARDQASQAVRRVVIPPTPLLFCFLSPFLTKPLYTTNN